MRFEDVELREFRTYPGTRLAPAPGLNLVTGANAAGKTNLLEALALLATGRSPRVGELAGTVRIGAPAAGLEARLADDRGGEHRVRVRLEAGGERRVALDGKPVTRLSQLAGLFPLVQLFPEDLGLPTGPPAGRRAYLDLLASLVVPGYLKLRQEEERAVRQRNAALKQGRPARELAALAVPFLDRAAEVHGLRAKALGLFRTALAGLPAVLGREQPGLEYWAEGHPTPALRARLAERLEATRDEERRLKATQVGPHRDDFRIRLADQPVAGGHASRGQLRTLLLRMKLAEAALLRQVRSEAPVLLLDDALSDMDPSRREATLEVLREGVQTFLSVPDRPGDPGARGAVFRVASGAAEMVA